MLRLLRLRALGYQCFDLALRSCRSFCTVGLSTSKMASKRSNNAQRAGAIAGAELARVHGGVRVADVFEDRGQRLRRIQIVIQALFETALSACAVRSVNCCVLARRRTFRFRGGA